MITVLKKISLGMLAAFTVVGVSNASVALAHNGVDHSSGASHSKTLQANLSELNTSGTTGTTTIEVVGDNQVRVKVNTTGASANLPHAQHLHVGGNNVCPDISADKNNSGFISTVEGQPSYGVIKVSLTTSGDMSPDSGLAVERMPKADKNGNVSYERTFTLPEGVTQDDLAKAVVVQHGISKLFADKTMYDGDAKSSLNEELPFEATAPAACGVVTSAPTGGVDAGFGPANELTGALSVALGAISLGAAGAVIARRRAES